MFYVWVYYVCIVSCDIGVWCVFYTLDIKKARLSFDCRANTIRSETWSI